MDDFHRLEINRDRFKDNQKEIKRQDMNNEQMQKGNFFNSISYAVKPPKSTVYLVFDTAFYTWFYKGKHV